MLKNLVAYANTLTGLYGSIYAGLDVVSRELTGFIPSVNRDTSLERAAVGNTVIVPISDASTLIDISPAMTIPEPTNHTVGSVAISITKAKTASFGLNGEEARGLENGMGVNTYVRDQIAQSIRALTNEIETDIATAAYLGASRAYGGAATAVFGTNLGEVAQVRKILDDNGAPASDRSLVIDTTAGAALRTLTNLTRVNEAGNSNTLRFGELLNIHNFAIRESAQVAVPAVGTAAATADVDTTGYAVGSTSITLAAAGSGTIIVGDIVTFAGDSNKYVVTQGVADVSAGGVLKIAAPGLRKAISTSASQAVTVIAQSTRSVGFSRNAIQLVARAPEMPPMGDAAIDSMMITDPISGLPFELRVYKGHHLVRMEVGMAWGVKVIKPEHVGLLIA